MTTDTIVAVYRTKTVAELAITDLVRAGIPRNAIEMHSKDQQISGGTAEGYQHQGGFFAWLFGESETEDSTIYSRNVESGHIVVTVITDSSKTAQVTNILESHNPIDIDHDDENNISGRTEPYVRPGAEIESTNVGTGSLGHSTASATGTPAGRSTDSPSETMQLKAEELQVGKRQVRTGVTRLRRYTKEVPVEEQIRLRNESVRVVRRPMSSTAIGSPDAFVDKTIEVVTTQEEPIVTKTVRVVEEVGLEKEVTEREETIHDTVRHEDVEVKKDGDILDTPVIEDSGRTTAGGAARAYSSGTSTVPGATAESTTGATTTSSHPNLKHPVETAEDKLTGAPTPAERQEGKI